MSALSSFLQQNFDYDTGRFEDIPRDTPGTPWMIKGDYNVNSTNKITFRYNQLDSSTAVNQSGSSSLGTSRPTLTTNFLTFENSNYTILENLKSGVGEWNSSFATLTNNLIVGYTFQDESRDPQIQLFPFVVIGDGAGSADHGVRHPSRSRRSTCSATRRFQAQDSVTKYTHEPLVDASAARSRSSTRTTRSTSASRAPIRTTRWPTSTPTPTATSPIRTAPRRPSR